MKKRSKLLVILSLCMTMLFSFGTVNVYADGINDSGIEARVPLYTAKFPKTQNVSQTYTITVKPYGSPLGKDIGNVTMHATLKYDEVWYVDANGNKISFIGIENKKATSAYADYSLKINGTVSNTSVSIESGGKNVIISGIATYSLDGNTIQDSYRFVYSV